MSVHLLSGNEGIARGAYEGGVTAAFGYPGTPSTEILENLVQYKDEVYCEWSPNEKVALEAGVGACLAGARVLVTMKHVGLNVAADPLLTLAYIGVEGGLVLCVADDPGQHSSQTEQDTRQYARLAKIPVLEPSDSQEACDFVQAGLDISEQFRTPVILRSTTRVSHSRSLVKSSERIKLEREIAFCKDPARHCPLPVWGRRMRRELEDRLQQMTVAAANSPLNRMELRDGKLGIITSSIAYQYVREVFPEASVLKLGWAYPFPDSLIRTFAEKVEHLLVIEELDNILEEHVKALGFPCDGKNFVPVCGELSVPAVQAVRNALEGREQAIPLSRYPLENLPGRPPVFCPGCPHRGIFYGLTKFDVLVTGDIGCYSLAVFPPLNRTDVILCMGGGISMAHGLEKSGEKRKVVGVVGDSTFFHSGITGLLDIVYNRGTATIIVVDNRTTAMTGHQDHPGTGRTLMGENTREASIEALARACGVQRVRTVNPYNLSEVHTALSEELAADEPSLIISRAPCPLKERHDVGPKMRIDSSKCKRCGACLKLGCPAIENSDGVIRINSLMCAGCGICAEVCRFAAIMPEKGEEV
ncbi:MAG: indolepyruvate ferredoxin oxidoreductase subunit alpha [Lentisphaeria bacterium]